MRVLVVRLSALGDVILATAAVEALAEDRPDAEVHVLTKPGFRELFTNHPAVARVLRWEPAAGLISLGRLVRDGGYDWVADLHGNLRSRALRFLAPGPRWVRYRKGSLRRRLAVLLRRPELLGSAHVVDRYVEALRPLGVRTVRRLPRVYPGPVETGAARRLLTSLGWDGQGPLAAFAPGARRATKAWPAGRWAALCRESADLARPVLLGGPEEAELCAAIARDSGGGALAVAGRTGLLETAAVLRECRALVTNDSAPLHLATATGTRVIALFGPTVAGFGFYPLGPQDVILEQSLACRPCSLHGSEGCPQGHRYCMEEISTGDVLKELRVALSTGAAAPR